MILDRGFRDSLDVLKSLGIDVAIASFLDPNQKQIDVQNANNSRFVTMLRWVVESINARIKRFKWFNQVVPNSSLPSIQDFICILAALLNCFHASMKTPSPDDDDIIRRMNSLRNKSHTLLIHLNDCHLTGNSIWNVTDIQHLPQKFPKLSLSDIRTLTLGISLKMATYFYYLYFRSLLTEKSSKLCRRTYWFYRFDRSKCRVPDSILYRYKYTRYYQNSIPVGTQEVLSILYMDSI